MPIPDQFRFKRLDKIGAADAADDQLFLAQAFVDTGDLETLRNCSDPRRIVLGRTGAGKSALLKQLQETEARVIQIEPESLALAYVSNSTILRFLMNLGVRLDIFFRLLWRHVLTVELLKNHFEINSDVAKKRFVDRIRELFGDKKHAKAVEYLERWGQSFWEETEYRIREVTQKLETDLKASIGPIGPEVLASLGASQALSTEQKGEIVDRAQTVVNKVQIRQLSDIITLLDDVLDDRQKTYFVAIDRLDENWIEDRLRYKLIRALVETIRDFRKVRHAKVVAALRVDLLERVFKLTRDPGFQEEKYEALFLPVTWTRGHLEQLLNRRINVLIKQRYTNAEVSHKDVLPRTVRNEKTIDYMIDRTMERPRDVIMFFNACIEQAVDKPKISSRMLRAAEGEYSRKRLRSLADEWYSDYPNLMLFAPTLRGSPSQFKLETLDEKELAQFCLDRAVEGFEHEDVFSRTADEVINDALSVEQFRRILLQVFYRVGLVGLKLTPTEAVSWVTGQSRSISSPEVVDGVRVFVHPMFWRVLGIKPV